MQIQNKLAESYWSMPTIYNKLFELNVLNVLFGQSRKPLCLIPEILSYKTLLMCNKQDRTKATEQKNLRPTHRLFRVHL